MGGARIHRLMPVAAVVCAVAALAGCGDDKEDRAATTIPGAGTQSTLDGTDTTPVGTATTGRTATTASGAGAASKPSKPSKTSGPSRTTTTSGSAEPPPPPPARVQKTPPKELTPSQADATSAQQAATLAKTPAAERCPDAIEDGAGVKDIVVVGASCGRAKLVIYSGGQGADAGGFVCDIVAESFAGTPTILYSCTRSSDDAKIRYTAVG